jgi:hypothetical protein
MNLQSQSTNHTSDAQSSLGTSDFYRGKLREILGQNLPKILEDPGLQSALERHFDGIPTLQQTAEAVLTAACQIKKGQIHRGSIGV